MHNMEGARFIKSKWHMWRKSIDPSEVSGKEVARNVHVLIASSYFKNICFRPAIISNNKTLPGGFTRPPPWHGWIVLTSPMRFSVFAPCNVARLSYVDEVSAICFSWSLTGCGLPSSRALLFVPRGVASSLSPHRRFSAHAETFLSLCQPCYDYWLYWNLLYSSWTYWMM